MQARRPRPRPVLRVRDHRPRSSPPRPPVRRHRPQRRLPRPLAQDTAPAARPRPRRNRMTPDQLRAFAAAVIRQYANTWSSDPDDADEHEIHAHAHAYATAIEQGAIDLP